MKKYSIIYADPPLGVSGLLKKRTGPGRQKSAPDNVHPGPQAAYGR